MHNRFHYKCCDKDTGISVEEVKQQSLKNAQKSRKSRSRTNLNSTSSISNTELNSSSPEKESEAVIFLQVNYALKLYSYLNIFVIASSNIINYSYIYFRHLKTQWEQRKYLQIKVTILLPRLTFKSIQVWPKIWSALWP